MVRSRANGPGQFQYAAIRENADKGRKKVVGTILLIVLGIVAVLSAFLVAGALHVSRSGGRPGDLYDYID